MKPPIATILVGALLAASSASAQESHSHPPPEKLGTVVFATSCAPGVAHDFEHAVALLHSFAYAASEEAFRKISAADPSCAMAHWGVAMTYFHQLWSEPRAADLSKGRSEIDAASSLDARSQRERQFIAALADYYHDFEHSPHRVRAAAYTQAMATVADTNPADTEAQVFYALALLATAAPDDRFHANQKRAAAILEPIYRRQPDHPGIAHYLIHAYDSAELAPRGLAAARAYSKIAPSAPHALHMPSHIFTRLGLWDDSIASNMAARAAAQAQGDQGEELHAMDYLVYAYLQRGRQAEAEQVVEALSAMRGLSGPDFKVVYAATAMPVRLALEGHRWDAAAMLEPLPESPPNISAVVFWARAVANARAGRPRAADQDITSLEQCRRRLLAAGNIYWTSQVDILRKEAVAWQLAADAHSDAAIRQLEQAADQEDSLEKLPLTPGPIVPAREQLGDLAMTLHLPKEALKAYRTVLIAAPGRRGALLGAARAAALSN